MKKIILVPYAFLLLFLTIFSYAFVDPNLSYLHNFYAEFIFEHRVLTSLLYTFFIVAFFIFYIYFLRLSKKDKLSIKNFKLLIAVTIAILFFSYPAMLSYDIFNYIFSAKALFFYRENPYIVMPIEFVGDPLLQFTRATNKIALYGPSWILASGIPYFLGFGNFLLTLFNFKLLVLFFYVATVYLIWKMSKNIYSIVFFALNPLVVIETVVSSHNDIFMMFFALLSLYFLKEKKIARSYFSLIISVFVKYTTLFLIPVLGFVSWKKFKKSKISWDKIFYSSSLLMIVAFFLSPLREEIYPWYAIWFLVFVSFLPEKKGLSYFSIALSFGLLLRYIPFMLSGTYFGLTPFLKIILTFTPLIPVFLFLIGRKAWQKNL